MLELDLRSNNKKIKSENSLSNYTNQENHKIPFENKQNKKKINFHKRITKIIKIKEFHVRIIKIIKILEVQARITKINKKIRIPCNNNENH